MSLSSVISRHSARALTLTVISAVAVALSACSGGFRPLYADPGFGGANVNLAQISVVTPSTRIGQRIRNGLNFESSANAEGVEKRYRLDIVIRRRLQSSLVVADGEARSRAVMLIASFRLVQLADNKTVLEGQSTGRAAYERFEAGYANVRAQRDAEDRAARSVVRDLKSRLEAFLATNPTPA